VSPGWKQSVDAVFSLRDVALSKKRGEKARRPGITGNFVQEDATSLCGKKARQRGEEGPRDREGGEIESCFGYKTGYPCKKGRGETHERMAGGLSDIDRGWGCRVF